MKQDKERAKSYLESQHTKELLSLLRATYAGGYYNFTEQIDSSAYVTTEDVKAELAKREHIPNKVEAKQIRKDKHKRNNNKGRN